MTLSYNIVPQPQTLPLYMGTSLSIHTSKPTNTSPIKPLTPIIQLTRTYYHNTNKQHYFSMFIDINMYNALITMIGFTAARHNKRNSLFWNGISLQSLARSRGYIGQGKATRQQGSETNHRRCPVGPDIPPYIEQYLLQTAQPHIASPLPPTPQLISKLNPNSNTNSTSHSPRLTARRSHEAHVCSQTVRRRDKRRETAMYMYVLITQDL